MSACPAPAWLSSGWAPAESPAPAVAGWTARQRRWLDPIAAASRDRACAGTCSSTAARRRPDCRRRARCLLAACSLFARDEAGGLLGTIDKYISSGKIMRTRREEDVLSSIHLLVRMRDDDDRNVGCFASTKASSSLLSFRLSLRCHQEI